jgi:DNA-binding GntR family transcriptional regulator
VVARDGARAEELMDRHIALTQEHWSKEASTDGLFEGSDGR